MTPARSTGRPVARRALVPGTGSLTLRRRDWTEQRMVLDSFPSVLAPTTPIDSENSSEPAAALRTVPDLPLETEELARTALTDHEPVEIEKETAIATAPREVPTLSSKAPEPFRNLEKDPDWYQIRRRCGMCGHDRYGDIDPWRSPRWITAQNWVICRTCYSVHRDADSDNDAQKRDGWVVPYEFFERRINRLPRYKTGVFVDCHPMGLMKGHCSDLFAVSIRIQELHEIPTLQAQDITCYSCIETTDDVEWLLHLLLYHLEENGVIRLNLFAPPFLSTPKAVERWFESKRIDVHHLPSRRGFESLLKRTGLEIRARIKTVNLPFSPEALEAEPGNVYAASQAVHVLKSGIESIANCGFGEEIVLSRKHVSPAAELLRYPWRPFGKVL